VSLTVTPVRATVLAAGLVMVTVIVELPVFCAMLAEPKTLAMVGGATTAREADEVLPVPPFVEVTLPVVLVEVPAVLEVTVAVTVQLPLVARDPPVNFIDVAVEVATEPLGQVVATPD